MAITLEEIAKRSNVSRSTVSRVINGDPNVKEETRQRVQKIIESVNFQPNLAARSLAAGRTDVIGLVIPAGLAALFTDPYFPQLVTGISTECNSGGYSVMLWLAEPEYERQMITKILHSGLLDGVIAASMVTDDPIVHSLYKSKMPFVLVGRHPTLEVSFIDVDNVAGGYEATMHLISQGFKRIATISGPQNLIAGYDRFQGYKRALKENYLPYDAELVANGDFSESSGYQACLKLIPQKPDAIFAANDTMAMGAFQALREAGLRVPEDTALVGFDDIPSAKSASVPLTTIRQPIQKLGAAAVNALIEIIDDPELGAKSKILPTELVIRKSSGSSPAGGSKNNGF
jgi:LacI family transcriptional regulator